MTDLSPAAQAVLDAYRNGPVEDELAVAAVLRVAANRLKQQRGWSLGVLWSADELLVIADEMEGR
jgi:hypothetical protein